MTKPTNFVTEYNQAKEFKRKFERNGKIGYYFFQIFDRNPQVYSISYAGVILATILWFKGVFPFDPPMSGWLKLLIFLAIWGLVTCIGCLVVTALNYIFDWAHDRERARDLLYAAYFMNMLEKWIYWFLNVIS